MAIAEQFAGLDMEQLIGAPLRATADASTQLANSTADFINRVGFDKDGKVRTVSFGYQSRSVNEDGTSNLDEMKVAVPMLAIVPIPNLQVDEVNILFDMEVKQSERKEDSTDVGSSFSGSAKLGFIKVNVTGNVSAHQSNTRSSDNSAKYHVDVRASNHGTPEGLARVLDMMAANVAPMLVDSTIKDGNGQNLTEKARVKAEKLKTLRAEMAQIEKNLSAANDNLSDSINMLKRAATCQQNIYLLDMKEKMGQDNIDDAYIQKMEQVNQSWNDFQNQAGDIIRMLVVSDKDDQKEVSTLFALLELDASGNVASYSEKGTQYSIIADAQSWAIECQRKAVALENELYGKKIDYNNAIMQTSVSTPTDKKDRETEPAKN